MIIPDFDIRPLFVLFLEAYHLVIAFSTTSFSIQGNAWFYMLYPLFIFLFPVLIFIALDNKQKYMWSKILLFIVVKLYS